MSEGAGGSTARLCRYLDTRHYLWGDDVSGRIKDWYYAGSREIHMSMWSLPPGGWFKHSDEYKSYYLADEAYLILEGEMTIHNPENGDVAVRSRAPVPLRRGPPLSGTERGVRLRASAPAGGSPGRLTSGRRTPGAAP